jgi:hypothetical protein
MPLREDSLFKAAERLDRAAHASQLDAEWYAEVRTALRSATVAVEARLHSLAGARALAREHPRLIPALEQLEATLARLLIETWEAKGAAAALQPGFVARVHALVDQMRDAAGQEFALASEPFNEPGGHE